MSRRRAVCPDPSKLILTPTTLRSIRNVRLVASAISARRPPVALANQISSDSRKILRASTSRARSAAYMENARSWRALMRKSIPRTTAG